ncbi:hypothetical protein B0O95_101282 [Mycetohabitans endofungorum]|uniref:Uncharacterized protein n=1 Tax=Mycetohabitans endofungorum TaxID=417203 RepID=A0A2P5KES4_9BURK|nr:hypothetical protein B0O95_101282 [Mycetohabitans endofungorum]
MRGLRNVAEQCLLAAAAQNIKQIALLLARLRALLRAFWRSLAPLQRLVADLADLLHQIALYRANSAAA